MLTIEAYIVMATVRGSRAAHELAEVAAFYALCVHRAYLCPDCYSRLFWLLEYGNTGLVSPLR
jgi:hypothetical protein